MMARWRFEQTPFPEASYDIWTFPITLSHASDSITKKIDFCISVKMFFQQPF